MTVDRGTLGSFGDLAVALGLLDPTSGEPNAAWFSDPVAGGTGTDAHGLRHVLADDDQRTALLHFVDQVLGPPEAPVREGATWVPLFADEDPAITVYGVVEQVGDEVRVGVGFDHTTRGDHPPTLTSRVHVPLFRFARRNGSLSSGGPAPDWLLLGREGGDITFSVDATLSETTPPPGEPSLGGASLSVTVPTGTPDVGFELTLRDLQLPGAQHPDTFSLDVEHPDQLGTSVLDLLAGLVRAQADALGSSLETEFQAFAALAGLLGLRDVEHLPSLPIADLPAQGVGALVGWVEGVLADEDARDAWLGQLAALVGGEVDADRDAVVIPVGTATGVGRIAVTVGVRVTPGTGGHPVLVPWLEVSLVSRTAVLARAAVDLLRVDTGSGSVLAVPDARIEAVFGDAGHPLVADLPTLGVGTVHVGVALDAQRTPAFVLNATDVTVDGATRAFVDLSTPDAALAAGADLVTGALTNALNDLGDAGDLVARLLGVTGTGGVPAISVPALVADPVGTLRGHWEAVLTDAGGAMGDLLGRLSALVRGAAAGVAPGSGSQADPWQVLLVDVAGTAIRLEAWRDGSVLHVDLVAAVDRTVLTDLQLTSRLSVGVATLDLAGRHATFATGASLSGALSRADHQPTRLALGPVTLTGSELAVEATWLPAVGARVRVRSDDLAVTVGTSLPVHVPLPVVDGGGLRLDAPDWAEVEAAVAALVDGLGIPEVRAALSLVGWTGTGPHLALGDLVSGVPATVTAAVEAWLADLLLDCHVVRGALGPVAALLSGFSLSGPLGSGTAPDPFRCPVAGEPRAPGLRVWLDPGCPPRPDPQSSGIGALLGATPDAATVADALRRAGQSMPELADLLVGRDSLGQGLTELLARWQDTDGLAGRPATLPADVTGLSLPGLSYAELVALGRSGGISGRVLGAGAGDIVHVGTEADLLDGRPDGTTVDLTGDGPVGTLPAGAGPWFVRLPAPAAAAAARPDRGGVGEQAARLSALLAGRGDVALVAYGAAGAAALRAAATTATVTDVVTVGAPWSEVSVLALTAGLSGDALELLRRLQRVDLPVWPDPLLGVQCTPVQRLRLLVQRSTASLTPDLPRADAEARRAGLRVAAVFGALDAAGLLAGLGAFAVDAVDARTPEVDESGEEPAQHALHVAVDVPVLDLDLGGLLVGAGAVFEACQVTRDGDGMSLALARSLTVELHLGVHDGWLVGGPGSGGDTGDVRWAGVRVVVPFDGTPGTSEIVLHEARALGIDKEAWVVRAGADTVTATGAVPEVRVLVGDIVGRLQAAGADLATLLSKLALLDGSGGLDLLGLDRLLHDPAATMRGLVAAAPEEIAAALRALVPSAVGSGSTVGWAVAGATLGVDLAAGSLAAGLRTDVEGLLPVAVDVVAGPAAVDATVTIGGIDDHLGGTRVVLATPRDGDGASVRAEWAAAGGAVRGGSLWPTLDAGALTDLVTLAVPAIALDGLVGALRTTLTGTARDALEAGLTACGLLEARADGGPVTRLPLAFVQDPAAYVVAAARRESADLAATGAALLDALAHLVVSAPPPSGTWPLADGVELRYGVAGSNLEIALHAELDETLDTVRVRSALDAGVVLRPGLPPAPAVGASVLVGELGLGVHLDPTLRVELVRAAPLAPLPLYPEGPGLGQAFEAAAASLLPELLDRIAALAAGPAGLAKDVGGLVAELGDALDLRESGHFTAARIGAFADDPGAALLSHLPDLVGDAASEVGNALNGSPARVTVARAAGRVTFSFGTVPDTVTVTLDATGPTPAVELGGSWAIPDVGEVRVDSLRLSESGVSVAATLGPIPVQAGPVTLRPLLTVAAGTAAGTRLLGLGLALDDDALQSVELRWALDAAPPVLVAVDRGGSPQVSEAGAPVRLLSLGVGLASGVVLGALPDGFLDARAVRMLQGVLFAEGATTPALDPAFALDLLDPDRLLLRAERLLWNAATDPQPLSVTIDGQVTIALAAEPDGSGKQLGISVGLPPGRRMKLADGDTTVELEVDASWIDPDVPAGLTIFALRGTKTGDAFDFDLAPGVLVGGVGLRFTKASGPLLSLGPIALDGFAVRAYAECDAAGVGGGAQVALLGLAVAPAGAGGNNSVANGIMADAGSASPAQRPAFSPALAIQQHPHGGLGVSIRAGDPPGPWWIIVQRQLGPLYVERVGFDEKETDGKVSRIALLFDGGVSLFGLNAQVDQLSITWLGGDLLDIHQWAVDLMGLAVSADMSGVTLAGGLLKTVDDSDNPAYVGMLIGKFGIYGLSVFGGYTSLGGAPSFFVFGALNGPIGGPPAFFVTGIGGGLGINRRLVAPTDPAKMNEFPFIQALDPYAEVPDPMDELRLLAQIFPPELDNFWFAAGISFTCFSLVDGVAVVAVSFGQGLEIDLLGLARLALPNPAAPLVSIELGLLARFSTTEGVFLIQAALTDNSWLLYEDVRLTGGFAFAMWWKGPLAGQFVLTIGGYHPDFHVDGYPVVPRLGLSWQVSDDISIKGGSYFALTSEALMAGVGVDAVADFGWAWARASFGADGLVYFDPFWYDVAVRASISAGVEIDTWLGTISFSVTTGCGVHVWGPDFSGEASVEVGPCTVTIPFGSDAKREGKRLDWSQFTAKYLEDAGGAARALSGITGRGSVPAATGGNTSAPPPDGTLAHPFEVYAEFEITFVTTVPSKRVDLGAQVVPVDVVRSDGAPADLGLNPMKASVSGSDLRIRLQHFDEKSKAWKDDAADLDQLGHAVGTDSFPIGVWGAPDPGASGKTPSRLPAGDVIVAGNRVTLTATAGGQKTGPEIDYYRVEAGPRRPLPFTARQTQRIKLRQLAGTIALPPVADVDTAVTAAAGILFAARPAPEDPAVLAAGVRSQVAGASFRGGITGPPLFGNLTDGLAVENAAHVTSEPQPAPPATAPPRAMDPRVVGFFAAGAVVAFRSPGTTVAQRVAPGRPKRRTAPTTESVQARLGAHLPVSLQVSATGAVGLGDTATPASLPFSGVPSSARSYRLGDAAALTRVAGLSGLGGTQLPPAKRRAAARKAVGAPATLASGDVVVLHAPDHGIDTSQLRPSLDLGGRARVTCVRGDGRVLLDDVRSGVVDVPAGTALVGVQADAVVEGLDGCPGWHTRSRVAALGPSAAAAAGAVLVVENGLTPADPGWTTAGDLVRGAARVLTRFSRPARTVVLVVESDEPERVGDLGLQLQGATRKAGVDPHLVMNGVQAVAVYDVVPDPGADSVAVSVAPGGGWRLTGVLASDRPADEVADLVLRRGLVAATARLTADRGPGCSPAWSAAATGATKRSAKKTVAKKTAGGRRSGGR